ncbi:MAG: hypothetical protein IPP74_09900 [Alphaproteobacteria bacterium]|nr:hypothetical protein [Alphaproteobacteria bacterium]
MKAMIRGDDETVFSLEEIRRAIDSAVITALALYRGHFRLEKQDPKFSEYHTYLNNICGPDGNLDYDGQSIDENEVESLKEHIQVTYFKELKRISEEQCRLTVFELQLSIQNTLSLYRIHQQTQSDAFVSEHQKLVTLNDGLPESPFHQTLIDESLDILQKLYFKPLEVKERMNSEIFNNKSNVEPEAKLPSAEEEAKNLSAQVHSIYTLADELERKVSEVKRLVDQYADAEPNEKLFINKEVVRLSIAINAWKNNRIGTQVEFGDLGKHLEARAPEIRDVRERMENTWELYKRLPAVYEKIVHVDNTVAELIGKLKAFIGENEELNLQRKIDPILTIIVRINSSGNELTEGVKSTLRTLLSDGCQEFQDQYDQLNELPITPDNPKEVIDCCIRTLKWKDEHLRWFATHLGVQITVDPFAFNNVAENEASHHSEHLDSEDLSSSSHIDSDYESSEIDERDEVIGVREIKAPALLAMPVAQVVPAIKPRHEKEKNGIGKRKQQTAPLDSKQRTLPLTPIPTPNQKQMSAHKRYRNIWPTEVIGFGIPVIGTTCTVIGFALFTNILFVLVALVVTAIATCAGVGTSLKHNQNQRQLQRLEDKKPLPKQLTNRIDYHPNNNHWVDHLDAQKRQRSYGIRV